MTVVDLNTRAGRASSDFRGVFFGYHAGDERSSVSDGG